MKKIIRIALLVLLVATFIGTMGYLYNKSRKKPVVHETKLPVKSNVVKKTVATGTVVPRKEIEIKPQVSGIIQEIYIVAGKTLKSGDLIAKIRIIPNMVSLNEAEARLKNAKLTLADNKIVYERQQKLYESKVISLSEFQPARLAYEKSRQDLETAENNLQLIKEGVSASMGATTNTLVRSTIDGMILSVPVEIGNSVIETNQFNEGTTIAIVADMSEMIFKGKIDETDVGKIKSGMALEVNIGALENVTFNGMLEFVSPKGVTENNATQFEIKAAVQQKEGYFIRSGYSATANIILDRRDSVMVIEESLLRFRNDSSFVDELTAEKPEQKFEEKYVKLGLSDGINVEVLEGVGYQAKLKKQ
ncbi:MAG: efflux RND transporter periplasmic adaptor subunit [Bacteroidales bacterium]|nr:efflux RND transporter periplasmic adaptor subunit [Bacteroidales bacterium]